MPGSGKTATAGHIRDVLALRGQMPQIYLEGNLDHVADFESVACLSAAEYGKLLEEFPECRTRLDSQVDARGDERFAGPRQLPQLPGPAWPEALLGRLAAQEVYEQPPEKYRRLVSARWQALAERAAGGDDVFIFECCFLQNPPTMLLGRHAEPVAVATTFVLELVEILQPLEPALIYLDAGPARPVLERVTKTRPPEWLEFVIGYHTQHGQGRARGWQGFDELVQVYEMRRTIELGLLQRPPWPHIRVPHSDWAADRQQVTAFLESFGAIQRAAARTRPAAPQQLPGGVGAACFGVFAARFQSTIPTASFSIGHIPWQRACPRPRPTDAPFPPR